MNFIKRAVLSVKARKGKTFLQIFIFTVICLLVLTGLTIQTAAKKSADLARQSLGGNVTLQFDTEKLMETQRAEGGRVRITRDPIALESAEELVSYEDVKGYNFYSSTTGIASDFEPIEEESEEVIENEESPVGQGRGGFAMGDISLEGVLFTDSIQEFIDGESSIVEGRHLTEDDVNQKVTMIENTIAEENELVVGDTINVQSADEEQSVSLEIVGIYETTSTATDMGGMSIAALNPFNKLYLPYTAVNELKGTDFTGTIDRAIYYMNDPENINRFVKQATQESGIDFSTYKLDANDTLYQQMIGPIDNVASFSKNVVYLVTIAGAIILGLIIMMSIRERKFEMGVLLALGEKKWKLISQLIVEILVVVLVALGISAAGGNLVASQVGDQLLTQQLESEEASETPESFRGAGMRGGIGIGGLTVQEVEPVDELLIEITSEDIGMLAIISFLIAIISTILPSLSLLRLQPKMILSKQD
ncbi:ABC transporter permease [Paenisporosarcina antarctica]|uniref:ABC transporter permease n=1 Tax=Paenisporosarcina antarctica TaxID=417367 RepID=A0A4P7A066_9BACL|nr:ABC transporter permease [Paenisporosarcina antarctica]QBP42380.1 ABC transporter permease [Paenisporosarcina antarctica]